jgi:myo-inositol-1(or 4)-monophosphatase
MNSDTLIAAIRDAADAAGAIALGHYGQVEARTKRDESLITDADIEVQSYLETRLGGILPEAHFIGEESAADSATVAAAAAARDVWVVDPIDGTAVFVEGLDTWCVCIGLLRDGQPYAGAVAVPAMRHAYSAVRGEGAWCDGRRIQVLAAEPDLDRASICVSRNAHRYLDIHYAGKVHAFGVTSFHHLLVSRGAAVGAIGRSHVWDHCAAAAILTEAGGVLRHLDGAEVAWREILDGRLLVPPLVSAPAALWDHVRASVSMKAGQGG